MDKTFTPKKTIVKKDVEQREVYIYEPGKTVVSNILNYSKALSVRNSNTIDKLELILN